MHFNIGPTPLNKQNNLLDFGPKYNVHAQGAHQIKLWKLLGPVVAAIILIFTLFLDYPLADFTNWIHHEKKEMEE